MEEGYDFSLPSQNKIIVTDVHSVAWLGRAVPILQLLRDELHQAHLPHAKSEYRQTCKNIKIVPTQQYRTELGSCYFTTLSNYILEYSMTALHNIGKNSQNLAKSIVLIVLIKLLTRQCMWNHIFLAKTNDLSGMTNLLN